MDEPIFVSLDSYEIIDAPEYSQSVTECFGDVPDVARSLIGNAKRMFKKIERCFTQHLPLSTLLKQLCQRKPIK